MAPPRATRLADRAGWALMIAIRDAFTMDADPGRLRQLLARTTVSWALVSADPNVREHVLSRLPAAARLLYRTVWLPRYARTTPLP